VSNSLPAAANSAPQNPFKSPSYPQRIHLGERQPLLDLLKSCEDRLGTFRQKLDVLGKNAERTHYERLFLQLQGARDQVADVVRRMPLEAGSLYHEDREKLQAASEAFDRVAKQWSA